MKSKSNFNSENEKLVVPMEFKGLFGSVRLPDNLKEENRKILSRKHSNIH